ncbi:MAG: alpha/beta hydrolase [Rhizobiaceae bacterium]
MSRLFGLVLVLMVASACTSATPLNLASNLGSTEQQRNISYASHDRNKYDLYLPADRAADTPIVLFFYGGSWENGKRADFRFVGNALAGMGIIAAIADYRVYPEVTFPAFVDDAARAFAAVHKRFGSSRPVFVMGHSAGAHIAALLALDPRYLRQVGLDNCDDVAGLIGLAGPYDFLPLPYPRLAEIFPQATRNESQPVAFASGKKPPALLLHGSSDVVVEPVDTKILSAKLQAAGNDTTTKFYDGVSHAAILGALSPVLTPVAPTKADILKFVADVQSNELTGCD